MVPTGSQRRRRRQGTWREREIQWRLAWQRRRVRLSLLFGVRPSSWRWRECCLQKSRIVVSPRFGCAGAGDGDAVSANPRRAGTARLRNRSRGPRGRGQDAGLRAGPALVARLAAAREVSRLLARSQPAAVHFVAGGDDSSPGCRRLRDRGALVAAHVGIGAALLRERSLWALFTLVGLVFSRRRWSTFPGFCWEALFPSYRMDQGAHLPTISPPGSVRGIAGECCALSPPSPRGHTWIVVPRRSDWLAMYCSRPDYAYTTRAVDRERPATPNHQFNTDILRSRCCAALKLRRSRSPAPPSACRCRNRCG